MTPKRKRGRPPLGTPDDEGKRINAYLLESHIWWLKQQRGGVSATLRKLVDRDMKRESRRKR